MGVRAASDPRFARPTVRGCTCVYAFFVSISKGVGYIEGCSIHTPIPDDMIRQFPAYKCFPSARLCPTNVAYHTSTFCAVGQLPSIRIAAGRPEPDAFSFEQSRNLATLLTCLFRPFSFDGFSRNRVIDSDNQCIGDTVFGDRRFLLCPKGCTSASVGFEAFPCLRDRAAFSF